MTGVQTCALPICLSTIKNCDRILYISNKGILESGSHDELMAKHGAYWELYTAQARDQGVNIA